MGAILIDFQNIHKRASLFFIPARIEPEIYVQLAKSINEISFVSHRKDVQLRYDVIQTGVIRFNQSILTIFTRFAIQNKHLCNL